MSKKILIVGGTGFIGHHVAREAIKKKYQVTSISLNKPKIYRKIRGVKYLICDISKKKNLLRILKNKKFNIVLNFGGHINHQEKIKTYNSHYTGCKNLANYFLKSKIDLFIQIGSSMEYGKNKSPQNEKMKCRLSKSTYGNAKLKSTNYLIKLFNKKNFPVVVLRPYLIYGPGQSYDRFIPIVIKNCFENKSFSCTEGLQKRDYLYIDDFVNLIFQLIKFKNKIVGNVFNVGSGKPVLIKKVLNKILKIIKKGTPKIGAIKMRKDEILNLYPNISKIKKLIKFKISNNLSNGLRKTILFYKNLKI